MAARINPSKGGKPDKIFRDALMIALKRDHTDDDGVKTQKITALAAKLVDKAIEGDVAAAKEIADRVDGRPAQAIVPMNPDETPYEPVDVGEMARAIAFVLQAGAQKKP